MSETRNEIDAGVPTYAAPPAAPQPVQPEEPARMNAMERLWGTLISPGETFRDVNRKPTILVPIILGMLLAAAGSLFFNWKVNPDWDRFFRAQIQKQMDRSGQSMTPEQMDAQVSIQKKIASFSPAIGAVVMPILYLIITGILALGMMLIQAKSTFKKILSVVSWSYSATWLVQSLVFIAVVMVQDQETLSAIDPSKAGNIVPSNVGSFLPEGTSGAILSIATSLDVFSIWYLILVSIGLAVVAGAKRITAQKTGTMVFGLWIVWVLVKAGAAAVFGG